MLKYGSEENWANNILDLRRKYNLPLKDENISNMSKPVWKSIVNSISTGLSCLVVALGEGVFHPPSITPLSLKLDCSNFVQSYFEI